MSEEAIGDLRDRVTRIEVMLDSDRAASIVARSGVTERFLHVEKLLDDIADTITEARNAALKIAAAAILALSGVQAGTSYLIQTIAPPEPAPVSAHPAP